MQKKTISWMIDAELLGRLDRYLESLPANPGRPHIIHKAIDEYLTKHQGLKDRIEARRMAAKEPLNFEGWE